MPQGMLTNDQLQALLSNNLLKAAQQQPVQATGMNPYSQLAINQANMFARGIGQEIQNKQIAQQLKTQQDEEMKAIGEIQAKNEDPTKRLMATGDYYLNKGQPEKANDFYQRAEKRLQLDVRGAELSESKRSAKVREEQANQRIALDKGQFEIYKQTSDFNMKSAGEKLAMGIDFLENKKKLAEEGGNAETAEMYSKAQDKLLGIQKLGNIKPPTNKEIVADVTKATKGFTIAGAPITKRLSKEGFEAFSSALSNYVSSKLTQNPKADKNELIKEGFKTLSTYIKKPGVSGAAKDLLSSVSLGLFDPSQGYVFDLSGMSKETEAAIMGGDDKIAPNTFNSMEEAEAANLPAGTIVTVGGKKFKVQ